MEHKVFISFKHHDEVGNETPETRIAEGIYKRLMQMNIPAFFSNRSLLDFGESAYKDAIEKALDQAKVLIVIGSCAQNLTSRWVKYEWSGFHEDILAGDKPNGAIIPYLHSSIPRKERPIALRNLETFSYDLNQEDRLITFVQNVLHGPSPKGQEEGTARQTLMIPEARDSSYDPGKHNESRRLIIQSNNTRAADMPAIEYALRELGSNRPLYALDLGCAYGYVTKDRFAAFENVRVVGLDRSADCIEFAKAKRAADRISYYCVDLESPDFDETMQTIMDEQGIEKFDLVFSTLVLHHLKDPVKLLIRVRKYLAKGGYIIVRGSDDGSVIAYNDQGLVQKIIDKHLSTPGTSDRLNGRKLYYQLFTSGYKDIRMMSYIKDLSGKDFDERHDIFEERFSYRIDYIKNLLKKDPANILLKNDLEWMEYALNKLEELFGNESFWYQEVDFVAVGRK